MTAINLDALKRTNAARWANAKLTRASEFKPVAKRLVAAKDRYLAVAAQTGVPWYFIAVTHEREAAQDWNKSLAQGDPWNKKSTHVPKGRGPFDSWEEAAIDALVNCAPYAARNKDWSIGGLLTMLEQYNGLGYANRGIPSPYIWSGTDQYQRGKYVADGQFSATVVDKQLGCAGLLLAMKELDPSINLDAPPLKEEAAPKGGIVVAGTVAAGGAAATAAKASGADNSSVALIVVGAVIVAAVIYLIIRKRRK